MRTRVTYRAKMYLKMGQNAWKWFVSQPIFGHMLPYEYKTTAPIQCFLPLTHWGRVAHICGGNLTIIGSDNGLSPGRRQAITWTNVGILLIGPLGTNFSEMLIEIHTFSFKKIHLNMSSGKRRPFWPGLTVLKLDWIRWDDWGWKWYKSIVRWSFYMHRQKINRT